MFGYVLCTLICLITLCIVCVCVFMYKVEAFNDTGKHSRHKITNAHTCSGAVLIESQECSNRTRAFTNF